MKAKNRKRRGPRISTTGNPNWCSPARIVQPVRAFGDGVIDLDPASNPQSIVGALVEYDGRGVDALRPDIRWTVRRAPNGICYVNPPYSRGAIDRWAAKIADEGRIAVIEGWNLIALLPVRCSAEWWQSSILPTYDAICYLNFRVKFLGAPQAVPWESALAYWGEHGLRFERSFRPLGFVERRR